MGGGGEDQIKVLNSVADSKKGPLIPAWVNQRGLLVAFDLGPEGQVVRKQSPAQALQSESPKFKSCAASVPTRELQPGPRSPLHSLLLCNTGAT